MSAPDFTRELSPREAAQLRARGLPDGAAVVERDECDFWGATYARNGSGLYVPEDLHPVEAELEAWKAEQKRREELVEGRPDGRKTPLLGCDLFSGCGGFSLGMLAAGIDVVAAVEHDPIAAHTYLANLGRPDCRLTFATSKDEARWEAYWKRGGEERYEEEGWGSGWRAAHEDRQDLGCRGFIFGDIRRVSGEDLLEAAGVERLDVVVGGPPCQGLSKANANACLEDPRNGMLWEYMRLVRELEPRVFMIENVPQLLTVAGGALFEALARIATDAGYRVRAQKCDAVWYGVPQYRLRALVLGTAPGVPAYQFPMPSHWALGRDPDGENDWTSIRPQHGGNGERVDVRAAEYDEATGTWSFDVEGEGADEAGSEAAQQESLFAGAAP